MKKYIGIGVIVSLLLAFAVGLMSGDCKIATATGCIVMAVWIIICTLGSLAVDDYD